MGGTIGNTNAEKWTEETVIELTDKIIEYTKTNQKWHIGRALIDLGHSPQLWSYLTNKFQDNRFVLESLKKAESVFESNIVIDTMSGDAKGQSMAIFYLKNKHGYVDKQELDGKLYNVIVKKDGSS